MSNPQRRGLVQHRTSCHTAFWVTYYGIRIFLCQLFPELITRLQGKISACRIWYIPRHNYINWECQKTHMPNFKVLVFSPWLSRKVRCECANTRNYWTCDICCEGDLHLDICLRHPWHWLFWYKVCSCVCSVTQDFQIHRGSSGLAARHLEILDTWPDFKFNLKKISREKMKACQRNLDV